ncbi:DUF397 domain-containing protein [Streptomyces sp. T028]|uniref:DUF397 domain-containing protein n=1 Tax=Streptomyces sp. T028 TaxID=3394379 RepID=UPI003A891D19
MTVQWQKSTFSGVEGENCIELADVQGDILLREGEAPGDVLAVAPVGMLALIRYVRAAPRRAATAPV